MTLYEKKKAKREFFRKKYLKENGIKYDFASSYPMNEVHLTDEELEEMTYKENKIL